MKNFTIKASLLTFALLFISNTLFSQNSSDEDDRMKIRLGYTTENIYRQILVTVDANTTAGIDLGYDSGNYQDLADDMYWMIEDRKFLIQGINVIDGVLDTETDTFYNIKETLSFSINLPAGEYLTRFELKFSNNNLDAANSGNTESVYDQELGIEEVADNSVMELHYYNNIKSISIKNIGNQNIKSVKIYNLSGQQITVFNNIHAVDQTIIQTNNLSAGNYILMVTTDLGNISKKVSVI